MGLVNIIYFSCSDNEYQKLTERLDGDLFKTDPEAKFVRNPNDISFMEPSRCFIVIYCPAALSSTWYLDGVRGLIQNSSTVYLLAHGNAEERSQGFWKDHVSCVNGQFGAKAREVPTESLAAELHSLVADCVRSPTCKDNCQVAGVNGSVPAAPAGEQQPQSIKKQVSSAGFRRKLGLTIKKVASKGKLKRPDSPIDSPRTAIIRSPISQPASELSDRPNSSSSHIVNLDELNIDPSQQWPLPPKDHQEHVFKELVDSSIWSECMDQPDSFEQPRSTPPSHAELRPDTASRSLGTQHRIKVA